MHWVGLLLPWPCTGDNKVWAARDASVHKPPATPLYVSRSFIANMNWRGFYPALEATVTSLCALKTLQSPETWQKLPALRKTASTVARPLMVSTYLSVCWNGFSFIITLELKESVKQHYTQAKPTDTSNLDVWNLRNTRPSEGHQQHEAHSCCCSLRQRRTVTTCQPRQAPKVKPRLHRRPRSQDFNLGISTPTGQVVGWSHITPESGRSPNTILPPSLYPSSSYPIIIKPNNTEFYFIHHKTVKCYFKFRGSLQKNLFSSFNMSLICYKEKTSFDI